MSNAGQAVLGVVGGVIGWFVGGPTGALYGFQLGVGAGTLLFPTQLPGVQGPRLSDSQQTVSQVGAPMPWVFGAQTVAGIVNWASPIREVATTTMAGGKGGPEQEQTTYTYFRSWSVILTDGEIAGIRRVWMNGKLTYDATPQGPGESDADFRSRLMANQLFLESVTIYLGTEDQLPDPTIESFNGAGNVPAFRGCSYIVFNDVQLLPEDGNRIPAQMKFEVYTSGVVSLGDATQYSTLQLFPWVRKSDPRDAPLNPLNIHTFLSAIGGANSTNPGHYNSPPGSPWGSLGAALAAKETQVGKNFIWSMGHDLGGLVGLPDDADTGSQVTGWTNMAGAPEAYQGEALTIGLHYNHFDTDHWGYVLDGLTLEQSLTVMGVPAASDQSGMINRISGGKAGSAMIGFRSSSTDGTLPPGYDSATTDGGTWMFGTVNVRITCQRVPRPPFDPCEDPRSIPIHGVDGYVVLNGELQKCGPWTLMAGTARVLAQYTTSSNEVTQYPLNPTRPLGHPDYNNQAFWEAAYANAVARGMMPAGLTYGTHYPKTQAFWYQRAASGDVVEFNPIPLSDVVAAICDRVGQRVVLRYDVTDLESVFITGYKITQPTSARAAIDPLRSVGFFDTVESGVELRFLARGKPPAATWTYDDLGAHFAEQERPPAVSAQKLLEMELPRMVRVHYQCPDRDFDPGEESSPPRCDTKAESVVDVELAVAITPGQAARVAETLYRDLWAARYVYTAATDISTAAIEAADCVLLPVDELLERCRIVSAVEMVPNLRQLSLVRDDDGAYVSSATGTGTFPTPPKMVYYGPVVGVLLDLPPLDIETDNNAGFYFAARPLINDGAFRGATLSRSTNADAGFEPVASVALPTPMGVLVTAVPAGPTTIVDWSTEIVVDLYNGALEPRTVADVLGGANAAAIGAPGRWNIVQFIDAELIVDRTYRLRGLLQGRRGTEYFVGTPVEGDQFIMLSLGTLARAPLDVDAVNLELFYRSTAIGRPLSTAESEAFTGRGESLRPFSPVHVQGALVGPDWVFGWFRRDRLATDVVIPMSEASEDYEVDILRGDEVLRTISVATKSATYPAAQQLTDFGTLQTSITVRVYQISAAVGRSHPTEASFES